LVGAMVGPGDWYVITHHANTFLFLYILCTGDSGREGTLSTTNKSFPKTEQTRPQTH